MAVQNWSLRLARPNLTPGVIPAVEATIDTDRFSLPIGLAVALEVDAEAVDGLGETEPEEEDVDGLLKRANRLGDFFTSSFLGVSIVYVCMYFCMRNSIVSIN